MPTVLRLGAAHRAAPRGHQPGSTARAPRLLVWALRLVAAAGLAVDAYVHADLAGLYDAIGQGHLLTQGLLFRLDAGFAAALAAAVLLVGRHRAVLAGAAMVAAGGLAALLLYRYVDVGSIGPIPNMYEPGWYPEKTFAAVAEAVALAASTAALPLARLTRRTR